MPPFELLGELGGVALPPFKLPFDLEFVLVGLLNLSKVFGANFHAGTVSS